MRIAISDYSGHPFQVELSRCLASRGHAVLHLHFAEFQTPKGALAVRAGDPPNLQIEGVRTGRIFDKRRFLRRRFLEARVGALIAARALTFAPDVVVGCNMPLDAQAKLQNSCARRGIAFVFWLQDVYSTAIYRYLSRRFGVLGRLVGRHYTRLEAKQLRSSDLIVPISERFLQRLDEWGVRRDTVRVIPNWAPLGEIYPVGKDNSWARRYQLHDKLVALYSGTLGLKHDPTLLLELARIGVERGLHIVVLSEGPAVAWLARKKQEMNLENLLLLPFQPMEVYADVLGAGDILLAIVDEEAASFSVPSKILSYLAAGKPIVASIASANDAALMIRGARAGLVAEPSDRPSFVKHVLALSGSPDLRVRLGKNARAFAESRFDINRIADRFEEAFAVAAKRAAAGRPMRARGEPEPIATVAPPLSANIPAAEHGSLANDRSAA
jgi:colanic acid biosynthesis glycosyl transferase WcaI